MIEALLEKVFSDNPQEGNFAQGQIDKESSFTDGGFFDALA